MIACNGTAPMQAGSETTSGVEIAVKGTTMSGATASSAKVMLFSAHYLSGDTQWFADTVMPNDAGIFEFNDLPPGDYNLYVFAYDTLAKGAAILGITVLSNNSDGTVRDSARLSTLHTITGTATHEGKPDSQTQVYIVGSPFYARTDSQGGFSFQEVPFGAYTVVARLLVERSGFFTDSISVDFSKTNELTVNVILELK